MRRKVSLALGAIALVGMAVACGDEDPTAVGGELIGRGIRTFEVVLEGSEFLQGDSTFGGLAALRDIPQRLVAEDFEGVLDAHTLVRIRKPVTVTYADTAGGSPQTDSIVAVLGARAMLIVDSTAVSGAPVDVQAVSLTEDWHAASVDWTTRVDTADVTVPWTTPGGTPGSLLGEAQLAAGMDTLVIALDSAAAAVLFDSAQAFRGFMLRSTTPGSRLRIRSVGFEFDLVPAGKADTVLTGGGVVTSGTILDPVAGPAPATELRTGGVPIWRTLLHFKDLSQIVVDCSVEAGESCEVPLRETSINLAAVLLQPVPGGEHRLEVPIRLQAQAVLEAEGIPLIRSPLSSALGATADSLSVEQFTSAPASTEPIALPVTEYLRRILNPVAEQGSFLWLAVTPTTEGSSIGFASFASLESTDPPRLRLILSLPEEALFR